MILDAINNLTTIAFVLVVSFLFAWGPLSSEHPPKIIEVPKKKCITNMEIKGKIHKLLPVQSGTGAKGAWHKREFVIMTEDRFPKAVCFALWNGDIDRISNLKEGDIVYVSFDIESKEHNEKWFTNLRAYNVVLSQQPVEVVPANQEVSPMQPVPTPEPPDELPF